MQQMCGKKDFTMLDGVHTAVGDLYGFIQSDKRCLRTESGQRESEFLNHTSFFILFQW